MVLEKELCLIAGLRIRSANVAILTVEAVGRTEVACGLKDRWRVVCEEPTIFEDGELSIDAHLTTILAQLLRGHFLQPVTYLSTQRYLVGA